MRVIPSFPTRRSSDLFASHRARIRQPLAGHMLIGRALLDRIDIAALPDDYGIDITLTLTALATDAAIRSEEHTSELQSLRHLVCRLLLEKKKQNQEEADAPPLHVHKQMITEQLEDVDEHEHALVSVLRLELPVLHEEERFHLERRSKVRL